MTRMPHCKWGSLNVYGEALVAQYLYTAEGAGTLTHHNHMTDP